MSDNYKIFYENDGKPNDEGDIVAVVDMNDGTQPERFKGKTEKDILDKVLVAKAEATRTIQTVARGKLDPKEPATTPAAPAPLTADDRFRVTAGLQSPESAPESVVAAVEHELGRPLADVARLLSREQEAAEIKKMQELWAGWVEKHPEYVQCPQNNGRISRYLDLHRAATTEKNLDIAFEDLSRDGLLVEMPPNAVVEDEAVAAATVTATPEATAPPESRPQAGSPARPAVTTRPRMVNSSGVRSADISGTDAPPKPAPKYTMAEVEKMSRAEYSEKLKTDPEFRAFVDGTRPATATAAPPPR